MHSNKLRGVSPCGTKNYNPQLYTKDQADALVKRTTREQMAKLLQSPKFNAYMKQKEDKRKAAVRQQAGRPSATIILLCFTCILLYSMGAAPWFVRDAMPEKATTTMTFPEVAEFQAESLESSSESMISEEPWLREEFDLDTFRESTVLLPTLPSWAPVRVHQNCDVVRPLMHVHPQTAPEVPSVIVPASEIVQDIPIADAGLEMDTSLNNTHRSGDNSAQPSVIPSWAIRRRICGLRSLPTATIDTPAHELRAKTFKAVPSPLPVNWVYTCWTLLTWVLLCWACHLFGNSKSKQMMPELESETMAAHVNAVLKEAREELEEVQAQAALHNADTKASQQAVKKETAVRSLIDELQACQLAWCREREYMTSEAADFNIEGKGLATFQMTGREVSDEVVTSLEAAVQSLKGELEASQSALHAEQERSAAQLSTEGKVASEHLAEATSLAALEKAGRVASEELELVVQSLKIELEAAKLALHTEQVSTIDAAAKFELECNEACQQLEEVQKQADLNRARYEGQQETIKKLEAVEEHLTKELEASQLALRVEQETSTVATAQLGSEGKDAREQLEQLQEEVASEKARLETSQEELTQSQALVHSLTNNLQASQLALRQQQESATNLTTQLNSEGKEVYEQLERARAQAALDKAGREASQEEIQRLEAAAEVMRTELEASQTALRTEQELSSKTSAQLDADCKEARAKLEKARAQAVIDKAERVALQELIKASEASVKSLKEELEVSCMMALRREQESVALATEAVGIELKAANGQLEKLRTEAEQHSSECQQYEETIKRLQAAVQSRNEELVVSSQFARRREQMVFEELRKEYNSYHVLPSEAAAVEASIRTVLKWLEANVPEETDSDEDDEGGVRSFRRNRFQLEHSLLLSVSQKVDDLGRHREALDGVLASKSSLLAQLEGLKKRSESCAIELNARQRALDEIQQEFRVCKELNDRQPHEVNKSQSFATDKLRAVSQAGKDTVNSINALLAEEEDLSATRLRWQEQLSLHNLDIQQHNDAQDICVMELKNQFEDLTVGFQAHGKEVPELVPFMKKYKLQKKRMRKDFQLSSSDSSEADTSEDHGSVLNLGLASFAPKLGDSSNFTSGDLSPKQLRTYPAAAVALDRPLFSQQESPIASHQIPSSDGSDSVNDGTTKQSPTRQQVLAASDQVANTASPISPVCLPDCPETKMRDAGDILQMHIEMPHAGVAPAPPLQTPSRIPARPLIVNKLNGRRDDDVLTSPRSPIDLNPGPEKFTTCVNAGYGVTPSPPMSLVPASTVTLSPITSSRSERELLWSIFSNRGGVHQLTPGRDYTDTFKFLDRDLFSDLALTEYSMSDLSDNEPIAFPPEPLQIFPEAASEGQNPLFNLDFDPV